ncbi:hypothetical protein glysoja_032475 [Glycine soja]|uniref:Uncharacterized protein n=1 Tax=Glycine soja TaxID=3848 RepID=A0A0B2PEU8_GLYSO|nr:hypothetical protein glysoja_032475 [Glycine soja]
MVFHRNKLCHLCLAYARVEETVDLRTNVELVRSVSDKHHDLLRPSARNLSRGQSTDAAGHGKGKYALIRDPEVFQTGVYDKPLPFFGYFFLDFYALLCGSMLQFSILEITIGRILGSEQGWEPLQLL